MTFTIHTQAGQTIFLEQKIQYFGYILHILYDGTEILFDLTENEVEDMLKQLSNGYFARLVNNPVN